MRTLETDAVIAADGSVRLLSPLPAWLKAGRQRLLLVMVEQEAEPDPSLRVAPKATPEMLVRRKAALEGLRTAGSLAGIIPDPAAWQAEIRADCALPGRE